MSERFHALQQRYQRGDLPWDEPLPPPEIVAEVAAHRPGRALDLGCGTGRATIYLAQHGWLVDGVDFVPEAIEMAEARASAAGVRARTRFAVASVSDLTFLSGPYDLAIDVGCFHGVPLEERRGYVEGVARLLAPGADLLLFARVADAAEECDRWMSAATLQQLLLPDFALISWTPGETLVGPDHWSSVWSRWRRRA